MTARADWNMPDWYWCAPMPGTLEFVSLSFQARLTDMWVALWRRADAVPGWRGVVARHAIRYPRLLPLLVWTFRA